MFLLYNLLILVLSPAIALYFIWRIVGSGKSRQSWRQQLGFLPESVRRRSGRPRLWVQAVSVGETVASVPIFRELRALLPDAEMIVSTTTTTGQEMAGKSISEADHVIYYPIDLLPAVSRAISIVKPDVFVSVESEIWPNFLNALRRKKIPAVMVNGIVSDKTYRQAMKIRPVYRWALSNMDRFLMQTQADADRVIGLGAPRERVEVVGNCKFDQEGDGLMASETDNIRRRYGIRNGVPVFIAGSTNPGEDEPVLDAFALARGSHSKLKMVLAPRQLERADAIIEMASARGFTCCRRSASESLTGDEDIVILDTFGELASVYGIGNVAFVGGSLIPKGGHNILQPIAHGKPVFFGPYTFKSRDLVAQAKAAGVGFEVADGEDLGRRVSELLSDPGRLSEISESAVGMMKSNKGASRRCAEAIADVLNARS
jgi:3-deoxy-D-manno-octulosonic-acid transferase